MPQSGSSSLGTSRQTNTTQLPDLRQLELLDSREPQVGRRRVELGVRHDDEQPARRLHQAGREPRPDPACSRSSSSATAPAARITSFGSEPFTPFNLLFYNTFQVQDSVTKFTKNHSMTFGGNVEKFHSDNSFYFGIQSAYSYNTLADFYADANGYLANPNRTVSPVHAEHLPGEVPPAAGPDDAAAAAARRRSTPAATSRTSGGRSRT